MTFNARSGQNGNHKDTRNVHTAVGRSRSRPADTRNPPYKGGSRDRTERGHGDSVASTGGTNKGAAGDSKRESVQTKLQKRAVLSFGDSDEDDLDDGA